MADREISVGVNVVPGLDQLTPQLTQQQRQAEELSRALAKVREENQRAQVMTQARAMFAAEQAKTLIPANQITALRPAADPTQTLTQTLQRVQQAAQGGVGGLMALTSSLGLFGIAAGTGIAAGLGLGRMIEGIIAGFRRMQPALAEVTQTLSQAEGNLNAVRGQGAPTAEQVQQTFQGRPGVVGRLATLQGQGNQTGITQVLREEQERARGEVARLQAMNLEQARAAIQEEATSLMNEFRAGGGRRNLAQASREERMRSAWMRGGGTAENMPEEVRRPNLEQFNPATIQQMGRAITEPLVNAQSRLQLTTAALSEGRLASLRPGAPGLEQMPSLAQARQMDVLDVSSALQQESMRDQREEARFAAQYRLWQEILEEQRRVSGGPPVVS